MIVKQFNLINMIVKQQY